ncbi:UNVERIFIED_CONTAM: hypothetical protein FKN15_064534 [Acipenser sinensis]
MRAHHRPSVWWEEVVFHESFSDEQWIETFRVIRATFDQLVELVPVDMEPSPIHVRTPVRCRSECSEYAVPSIASFPMLGIRCSDLMLILDSHLILFLRISKTDQLRQGQFIQLSKIDSPLCPYVSMQKYIAERKPVLNSDPLFINSSRTVISRHWFTSHQSTLVSRAGLPPQFYTPHSFRIKAATSAARTKINQHLIKKYGVLDLISS